MALPVDLVDSARTIVGKVTGPIRYVAGGGSRQDSVARAFELVGEQTDIVLVHDAARPFVSADLITRAIAAAADYGAAIAAVPVTDTVKRVTPDPAAPTIVETLAREAIYLAQTPQAFRRSVLRRRHRARPHGRRRDRRSRARRARRPCGPGCGRRSGEREDHDAGRPRSRACSRPAIRRPIGGACRHRLRSSPARGRQAVDPWRSDNPVYCGSARPLGRGCGVPRRHRRRARRGVRSAISAATFRTTIRSGRVRRASISCVARRA